MCHKPPDRHPTVTRTLRVIENRHALRRRGAALFRAEDFAVAGPTAPGPDRAGTPTRSRRRTLVARPRLVSRRPRGA